ncbi:GH25 family lysozyme [Blautia marasmi]|uniref:GH25 family lysozyme n=1 Tax=Blautia marasmi TaxID=1917868 RepID=UPI0039A2A1FE
MALRIIDVSEHNQKINWEQARNHIDGAILRCGYGMDMKSQDDLWWKYNADECTRLGIPFGVYLYSYANTDTKSRSEAAHVLRLIKGYKLSYPVYLDLEEEHSPDTRPHAVRGAGIFAGILEAAGYQVGIYANESWYKRTIGSALDKYTKWVAKYSSKAPDVPDVDIWQYTSSGSVPGISGKVDLNYCYKDYVGDETPVDNKQEKSIGNSVIRDGQIHCNNFTSAGIPVDGYDGPKTRKGAVMVLQTGLNMDYDAGLDVDGILGALTLQALGNHYVCIGECQYMATALEILLMLKGYNTPVECPGSFGAGLDAAVRAYQDDHGLTVDGIAGRETFMSLVVL